MDINSLATATTVESSDFIMEFNATNGARKISKSDFLKSVTDTIAYSSSVPSTDGAAIEVDSSVTSTINAIARFGRVRTIDLTLGGLNLTEGSNTIGTIRLERDRPAAQLYSQIYAIGTIGAGTAVGQIVRIEITTSGSVKVISPVTTSSTTTLRATITYIANAN